MILKDDDEIASHATLNIATAAKRTIRPRPQGIGNGEDVRFVTP